MSARPSVGRPSINTEIKALVIRMARVTAASVRERLLGIYAYDTCRDARGNVTGRGMVTTDARRNATRTCVDARGLVTRVIDQLGNVTTFQYDTAFNLRRVALPPGQTGNVLLATHDGWGGLTTQDDSATSFTRYFYDDIGNLLERRRRARSVSSTTVWIASFTSD